MTEALVNHTDKFTDQLAGTSGDRAMCMYLLECPPEEIDDTITIVRSLERAPWTREAGVNLPANYEFVGFDGPTDSNIPLFRTNPQG